MLNTQLFHLEELSGVKGRLLLLMYSYTISF